MSDLAHRFTYHRPDVAKAEAHARVRAAVGQVAELLDGVLPDGREKTLALTKLEEAMFWANAAIARN